MGPNARIRQMTALDGHRVCFYIKWWESAYRLSAGYGWVWSKVWHMVMPSEAGKIKSQMVIQMWYSFSPSKCYGLEIEVRQNVISNLSFRNCLMWIHFYHFKISLVNFEASLFMSYNIMWLFSLISED